MTSASHAFPCRMYAFSLGRQPPGPLWSNFWRSWFRRAFLALVLGALLPVASAIVICEIHCAVANSTGEMTLPDHEHGGEGLNVVGGLHAGYHLQHGGPCHLAAIPGMATEEQQYSPLSPRDAWSTSSDASPASYVPPPPKHKPRTELLLTNLPL
jgi:hypothetical protein